MLKRKVFFCLLALNVFMPTLLSNVYALNRPESRHDVDKPRLDDERRGPEDEDGGPDGPPDDEERYLSRSSREKALHNKITGLSIKNAGSSHWAFSVGYNQIHPSTQLRNHGIDASIVYGIRDNMDFLFAVPSYQWSDNRNQPDINGFGDTRVAISYSIFGLRNNNDVNFDIGLSLPTGQFRRGTGSAFYHLQPNAIFAHNILLPNWNAQAHASVGLDIPLFQVKTSPNNPQSRPIGHSFGLGADLGNERVIFSGQFNFSFPNVPYEANQEIIDFVPGMSFIFFNEKLNVGFSVPIGLSKAADNLGFNINATYLVDA